MSKRAVFDAFTLSAAPKVFAIFGVPDGRLIQIGHYLGNKEGP
jgi:hypothetical protein